MKLFEKLLGPKSKYDKSIPYTYEARLQITEGVDEPNSYFSDTICGLVEYLHRHDIKPDEVQVIEVYQDREIPMDVKLITTPDNQWLFKRDICRALKQHYQGHIQAYSCSFNDRNCQGSGP
ncbi:MAG TPA: hypothetical protein VFR06_03500 [Gallionellaceae bacterium]|nr:hypothetical protein [Gallionellaceae bacterium]